MRTKRPRPAISDFRYSPLVAALAVALAPQAFAVTKTVSNGTDSPTAPAGSLREALTFFQSNCAGDGTDRIEFASFPNGPFVSTVSSPLPVITCGQLVIDGAANQTPGFIASVQSAGGVAIGLNSAAPAPVTVSNLNVSSFNLGPALYGNLNSTGNVLTNNNIALSPTGSNLTVSSTTIANNSTGIQVNTNSGLTVSGNQIHDNINVGIEVSQVSNVLISNNQIFSNFTGIYVSYGGSTIVIDGNAITGNVDTESHQGAGIYLSVSSPHITNNQISANDFGIYVESDSGSFIHNNRIGTTDDGLEPMGNGEGIVFGISGPGTSFNTEVSSNVISGNGDFAIDLTNFVGTKIRDNQIGTSIDGNSAIPNGGGIIAYCGSGIEVSGNVISSNSGNAIEFGAVQGGGALGIVNNKIGVTGGGVVALGNNAYGVALYFGSCVPSGASGGTSNLVITGNTIANNTDDGVLVSAGTGNQIIQNLIYANGGKSINLGSPGGPRPNDAGDGDGGPNNGQNYPVLTSATRDWPGGNTTLGFTLDGPVGNYRIDVYSNASSANPGGMVYHGSANLPIMTAGPTAGSFPVGGLAVSNQPNNFSVTATALATNDTSEFSPTAFITAMPDVTVTPNPPTLNFGQVSINSLSPAQSFTLRSSGNAPYSINEMRLDSCSGALIYGGPFMISSSCARGAAYAPGQQCQITAQFAPITVGLYTNTIAICDNTNNDGPRFFQLNGTAVPPAPVLIAPTEFDFGSVLAGSKSPPQTFSIYNPSTGPINIGSVTVSNNDFVIDSTTCTSSIPAGAICQALVLFAPSRPQPSVGTLSVSAASSLIGGSSSPMVKIFKTGLGSASASLSGQGILAADIQLPSAIDFGAYVLNTPPIRRTVDILNTGNAVVSFSNISVTGPFVLTNGCPLNIAPGAGCTLTLDFSATTLGDFTGTLAVVSNAAGGTRTIALTAQSTAIPEPKLALSPVTMSFGDRLLGTTSGTQRVTIRNIGSAPAVISSILASPDFLVSGNTCGLSLAPASTCFADVALRPVGFGPRTGSLFVNSNAADSPNVVGLGGTGCRPFSSSSSRFGVGTGFNCAP
jgi:trimeric autotransporter adhesin